MSQMSTELKHQMDIPHDEKNNFLSEIVNWPFFFFLNLAAWVELMTKSCSELQSVSNNTNLVQLEPPILIFGG